MRYYLLLLLLPLLPACSSSVRIDTVEPSYVNIPKNFKKVLLINRTAEDPKFAAANKMERMLTGDWSKKNPKVSFEILNGLSNEMTSSMKSYQVTILTDTILRGTGNQQFPDQYSPAFIDSLCTKYSVDMVISLETMNLDVISKVNGAPATFNVVGIGMSTILNGGQPTYTLVAVVKAGYRVYPADGTALLDQFQNNITWDFGKDGVADLAVLGMLSNAKESMRKALRYNGSSYGFMLCPHPVVLHRTVYTRGHETLESAGRYTNLGKWDDAMNIWDKNLTTTNSKLKRRSMYNLAVYYEVMGNLDAAIKMAESCYSETGFRDALDYANALRSRKAAERKVEEQTGN